MSTTGFYRPELSGEALKANLPLGHRGITRLTIEDDGYNVGDIGINKLSILLIG